MDNILDAGLQNVSGGAPLGSFPVDSGTYEGERNKDGTFRVVLPSGRTVIVDGNGDIIG